MPKIPPGIYHIRYAPTDPPPPIGGSYATSEGFTEQISAKALRPPFQQKWAIAPIDPDNEVYSIVLLDSIPPTAGWGLGGGKPNHVPVVLIPTRYNQWFFEEVDFENRIFQIIDPSPIIGVTKAVDLEGNLLFVNSFPVGADLPLWQIIPADSEE